MVIVFHPFSRAFSFLLKEESGLADTLVRMRSNLDACRRTRTEVKEAQELEREIGGVYEAGHAMFAAALLATRERAEELCRRVEEAKQKRDTALRERDAVAGELEEQTEERTREPASTNGSERRKRSTRPREGTMSGSPRRTASRSALPDSMKTYKSSAATFRPRRWLRSEPRRSRTFVLANAVAPRKHTGVPRRDWPISNGASGSCTAGPTRTER